MGKPAPSRSPLAPPAPPRLPEIAGATLHVAEAGFKYRGRADLLILRFVPGTTAAGVFTRSAAAAAPVHWSRAALQEAGAARAIVITAGNANAFTGPAGEQAVANIAQATARALDAPLKAILIAQTGVIGVPFPVEKYEAALAQALDTPADWPAAAAAIMTTDTFPKLATRRATIAGIDVTLAGIAKGSGMIAPDMATMLGCIVTDARLAAPVLQSLLAGASNDSFNAITVDGDSSTNDTVFLCATGGAGHPPIGDAGDPQLDGFRAALTALCIDLAQQIVRDGEGARKFVEIAVTGAASPAAAKRIALSIANSPLVKTAIAGGDANWGRLVMAVGKAGEKVDISRLAIWFGDSRVAYRGAVDPAYREEMGTDYFKRQELCLRVDVGVGHGAARVWTCDLTHGYIAINADYRS
ncbi:MAG: bifunctional glutamate N-acetyltransferase/amino-acid acetyltransferase ArgJ [Pseudomonadota bacterium]